MMFFFMPTKGEALGIVMLKALCSGPTNYLFPDTTPWRNCKKIGIALFLGGLCH